MADLSRLRPYTLQCRVPPWVGTSLVEVFTDQATRYRHSIRRMGGFWEASWWMPVSPQAPASYLRRWFDQRLGYRVQEKVGSITSWEGIIWQMELSLDGYKERRELGEVWNALKTLYTDTDGNNQETAFFTNDTSITRYGRRELILTLDEVTAAEAEAAAQTELTALADAWPRTIAINKSLQPGLFVQAVGDIFTANNRYVTAGDGSTGNVSDYVAEIVGTDCDFLVAGRIHANTTQVKRSFPTPMRAWDAILQLTEAGDGTNPWLFWVDAGGRAAYQAADNTPLYEWRGQERGLASLVGGRSPWMVWPGVVRNMKKRPGTAIPETFLQDARDSWIAEVEMADGQADPMLKPEGFDEEQILRATEVNRKWLEEETDDGEPVATDE